MNRCLQALKPWGLSLCAVPALWWWAMALADQLGANPAEALIRALGDCTLWLLCLTLAVTPLRRITGWAALAAWRRGLGVWTAGYALQHALAYAWLDQGWGLRAIIVDVGERPFILVGWLALLWLLPLALTSFDAAIRWLGAARWRRLHRLVYAVAILAIVHFWWMRSGKRIYADVWVWGAVVAALLAWRLWEALNRARARALGAKGLG